MAKFRDGFIGPIIILFVICTVVTFAVAGANAVTAPIIEELMIRKANEVRQQVLPAGDSFSELSLEGLPEGVTEAYAADNGAGIVFKSQARGYDGQVVWMIGIDADGNIAGINMFDHTETSGIGTKVGQPDYLARYVGQDNPDAVDGISGATRTSTSLKNALSQALEAYALLG